MRTTKPKKSVKPKRILVVHGPNLHLLGKREPRVYGKCTLAQINKALQEKAQQSNVQLEILQSNSEGEIVDAITNQAYTFLIINPAAYTHTSVAIRDALLGVHKPAIEVHLSNIYKREDFRRTSMISDVVIGVMTGFGTLSYLLALDAAVAFLSAPRSRKV